MKSSGGLIDPYSRQTRTHTLSTRARLQEASGTGALMSTRNVSLHEEKRTKKKSDF